MPKRKLERMFRLAESCLEQGKYESALRLGDRLIAERYTGGFEIKARALAELDQEEAAIQVLEEGVEQGPSVTVLWFLLGSQLSNVGRFQEALAAFHRYRESGADEAYVLYNLGLVYSRMGDPAMAISFLDQALEKQPDEPRILAGKIWCYVQLERFTEAVQLFESLPPNQGNPYLLAHAAHAYLQLGQVPIATELAWTALRMDKSLRIASDVIRSQNDAATARTRVYRVVVVGKVPREHQLQLPLTSNIFQAVYWVYCDHEEEALEFIRAYESDCGPLEVDTFEPLDDEVEGNKGVVFANGVYLTYRRWLPRRISFRRRSKEAE